MNGEAEALLHCTLVALERVTAPSRLPDPVPAGEARPSARALVTALDPSFRAQEISFVVGQVGGNVEYAAAESRSWLDRILGRQPAGFTGTLSSAGERARAFARLNSAWLHNSLSGAAAGDLWNGAGPAPGNRVAARQTLVAATARMAGWFDHFAAGLTGAEALPDALDRDEVADDQLIDAVAHDLGDGDGHATATGVRVIWTGDHLDAVRRLQESLLEPARAAVAQHALLP